MFRPRSAGGGQPPAVAPVLTVTDLHKTFFVGLRRRRAEVLRGVSLTVQAGEVFGFLGPNGAGKTTTIKACLGLVRPDRGRVTVLGGDFGDPLVRARVGFMPEQAAFHEYLSGSEVLTLHGRLAGLRGAALRARCDEALEHVSLREAAGQRVRTYSKGMLQRLSLAQALLARPALVILDEPMSGLDPLGRRDVRDILLRLRQEGTTVFFSTHILSDVEAICDRVAIVAGGRTLREVALDDLSAPASDRYDLELRGPPDLARALDGLATPLAVLGPVQRFELGAAAIQEALARAGAAGARLQRLEARRTSLEDYFLAALRDEQGQAPGPGGAAR